MTLFPQHQTRKTKQAVVFLKGPTLTLAVSPTRLHLVRVGICWAEGLLSLDDTDLAHASISEDSLLFPFIAQGDALGAIPPDQAKAILDVLQSYNGAFLTRSESLGRIIAAFRILLDNSFSSTATIFVECGVGLLDNSAFSFYHAETPSNPEGGTSS